MICFKLDNHNQPALFPLNLEDLIASNHLVSIVNLFINEISYLFRSNLILSIN